jgi:hypothetical protein
MPREAAAAARQPQRQCQAPGPAAQQRRGAPGSRALDGWPQLASVSTFKNHSIDLPSARACMTGNVMCLFDDCHYAERTLAWQIS